MERFDDLGAYPSDFGNKIVAQCPGCKRPVWIIYPEEKAKKFNLVTVPPVTCLHCGYIREGHIVDLMKKTYPYFYKTYSLYFKADCCGNTFFAYNPDHLQFLEDYVKATLRTRQPNINRSLVSRLPQWMKDAKNRKEIVKTIKRLKEKYEKEK